MVQDFVHPLYRLGCEGGELLFAERGVGAAGCGAGGARGGRSPRGRRGRKGGGGWRLADGRGGVGCNGAGTPKMEKPMNHKKGGSPLKATIKFMETNFKQPNGCSGKKDTPRTYLVSCFGQLKRHLLGKFEVSYSKYPLGDDPGACVGKGPITFSCRGEKEVFIQSHFSWVSFFLAFYGSVHVLGGCKIAELVFAKPRH